MGGWNIHPHKRGRGNKSYGPRLSVELFDESNELQYLPHLLPVNYIRKILIPATNNFAPTKAKNYAMFYSKFVTVLSLIYPMEVYKLPKHRMYWNTEEDGIFATVNFGEVICRNRFENIAKESSGNYNDKDEGVGKLILIKVEEIINHMGPDSL